MPRACDYLLEGYTYHLTHRCHNRDFHLRFDRDRDVYREWLREGVRRYKVPVYGYCLTRNHVHVVAHVADRVAASDLMHLASGSLAKQYNLRKGHEGSVWEHPYQCTAIEDGRHLLNCLRYVDLNMVRAGVVSHPSEWRWCGFDELTGKRTRYRIIDVDGLIRRLNISSLDDFRAFYGRAVEERLAGSVQARDPYWTEPLAVGSHGFVEKARCQFTRRHSFEYEQVASQDVDTWMVKESGAPYGTI